MKIYCAGAIRGDARWSDQFREISRIVEESGHEAFCEITRPEGNSSRNIYERDMAWLSGADALIAEVSGPSHGVGYEIAAALLKRGIPVLCLRHRNAPGRLSAMIGSNTEPGLETGTYESPGDLRRLIADFLRKLEKTANPRK